MQNEENETLNMMDINNSNVFHEQSNINDPYLDSSPILGSFQIRNTKVFILIILIMLVLGIVLFNTFKPKKLNCSLNGEFSDIKTTFDFDFTFFGDKPKKLDMVIEADLDNHMEYKDNILNAFKTTFGDKKDEINKEGGKAIISSTDDSVVFEVSAGTDGIDTMLSAGGKSISYDEIKKEFENLGYTCK